MSEEGRRHAAWWEQAWEAGSARYFGIWRGDRYLGSAGLSEINLDHRVAGLGYWVRSSETGQGVATSAATAIIAAGFEHLGLQRIEIMAASTTSPVGAWPRRSGAILEGTLRKRQVLDGVPVDCALYSVIDLGPRRGSPRTGRAARRSPRPG